MTTKAQRRSSSALSKAVALAMFRRLDAEMVGMRSMMEDIRTECSANLRRCGELQRELDEIKKTR